MNFSIDFIKHPIRNYKSIPIAAKAGIWFLFCNFIQKGISTITTPVFTRLLSTDEYGKVNIFYSWADILGIFITFGLSSAVYARGLVKNEIDKSGYTKSMIGLSLFTSAISLFVALSLKLTILSQFGLSILMIIGIYAYVLFNTITEFWYQQKRVDHDYIPFVKLTLSIMILKPLLSIIAILYFPEIKVLGRIIPDIAISGIVAAFLFILMLRKQGKLIDKTVWKESMIFVLPLLPHYLSQRVLSISDRIMISELIGDSEAGIYSLAYSIGMLLLLLNNAMDSTVSPWAYKKIKDQQYTSVSKAFEKLLIEYGLCALCFSFFAPEIVMIFAPDAYHEAIIIIPIIALSSFFMFSYLQFVYFEYYSGKTQYVMIATISCAIVNLVLNYIFIKQYGYIAAAYTTLLCYILYSLGHYFIMRFLCKKHYKTSNPFNIFRISVISIVISIIMFICLFLYNQTIIRWVLGVVCVVVTSIYSIIILKEMTKIKS